MFRFDRSIEASRRSGLRGLAIVADPVVFSDSASPPGPFVFRENLRAHSESEKYI
jgi:hypothetical protein